MHDAVTSVVRDSGRILLLHDLHNRDRTAQSAIFLLLLRNSVATPTLARTWARVASMSSDAAKARRMPACVGQCVTAWKMEGQAQGVMSMSLKNQTSGRKNMTASHAADDCCCSRNRRPVTLSIDLSWLNKFAMDEWLTVLSRQRSPRVRTCGRRGLTYSASILSPLSIRTRVGRKYCHSSVSRSTLASLLRGLVSVSLWYVCRKMS